MIKNDENNINHESPRKRRTSLQLLCQTHYLCKGKLRRKIFYVLLGSYALIWRSVLIEPAIPLANCHQEV